MRTCATQSWSFNLFISSVLSACGAGEPTIARQSTSTSTSTSANTNTNTNDAAIPDLTKADAQELFDYPYVPTFDVSLPAKDWEALKINARDEQYVPVQARFEGQDIGTIGLRFKGSYGSLYDCFDDQGNMICPRLSMKMKFDEYVVNQRFYGLKRLSFNAYIYDDSRMKEKLAYDLYRAVGIVTPRSAWAVLRVNGEPLGLFGMVEVVDGRFTADRWPYNPDGNLYKELWPTHASSDQIITALQTNEDVADISAYQAFSQAVLSANEASVLTTLGRYMDLNYVARYMAVDDALVSYDSVTYFWTDGVNTNNHNYFVYEESPTRFTLIPWDAESTFWINPDHTTPHWTVVPTDCSLTYEYWGGLAHAPGCDRVFRALDTDLSAWRAAARELLDGPFAESAMIAAINRHAALIGAAARSDPTPTKYTTFDQAVQNLRSMIPQQRARLEQLIAD